MKGAPVFVVVDAFSDEAFIHQTGRVARTKPSVESQAVNDQNVCSCK